jgi:hypothetical protein
MHFAVSCLEVALQKLTYGEYRRLFLNKVKIEESVTSSAVSVLNENLTGAAINFAILGQRQAYKHSL